MYFLQMSPEDFLSCYVVIFVASLVVAAVVKKAFLYASPKGLNQEEFDHYDIAYLTGGPQSTFLTAVATLCNSNHLRISSTQKTLDLGSDPTNSANFHFIETKLMEAVKWSSSKTVPKVYSQFEPALDSIKNRLIRMRLRPSSLRDACTRLSTAFIIGFFPLVVGFPRLVQGMEKHRPVGFLILLLLASFAYVLITLVKPCLRTTLGDDAVKLLKKEYSALELNFRNCRTNLSGREAALAYALFGGMIGVLGMSYLDPYASAKAALQPNLSGAGGGSSCGGGGCGSSCGGGGGCGGGCGGGGCGG